MWTTLEDDWLIRLAMKVIAAVCILGCLLVPMLPLDRF